MAPTREHSSQPADFGAGIATGVEVSSAGLITTGDKATDELLQAAHSGRIKAERETLNRQKKQHAEDMASAKKRQIELDKPASNRLSWLADRSMDSTWRAKEIQAFARATGAGKFEITCSSPKPGEKAVKKVFTAEQLQNPATIKSMATMSARRFDVSIRPDPASGVILLKGLDADGIKKLEAVGLPPAAVVDIAGKKEAWIATGTKLSADERTALMKRLETLTGVEQKHGGAGGLVGFSSGQKSTALVDCPGQVAPAAAEILGEVRAEIFEAKAQAKAQQVEAKKAQLLASTVEKTVKIDDRDFVDVGGIKDLPKDWLRDACRTVTTDQSLFFAGEFARVDVEREVLKAMARQGVEVGQANRAVYEGSSVFAGNELGAAQFVTETYTRVALENEKRSLEGVDLQEEARKRYPDILKRAERGSKAEIEAYDVQVKSSGQEESERMAKDAELHRSIKAALAAADLKAQELDGTIKPDD